MGWLVALAVLILLAILPLGVNVRYDSGGTLARIIAGPVRFTVFPRKKKRKKSAGEKKGKSANQKKTGGKEKEPSETARQTEAAQNAGGSWKDFMPLVRVALDFLGDFRRKLRVDRLDLKLILAGDDPAALAQSYGGAWAALGNLWPRLEQAFVIKKRDVQIECDFTAEQTLVFARMDITITLGRLLTLAVRYGYRTIKEYLKINKRRKGGAAV